MKESSNNKNGKRKLIVFIFILIFIIGLCFIYISFSFQLKGDKLLSIDYNETFKDPGFKASIFAIDISDKVKITGKVDTKKIGKYTLKYSYNLGFIPIEKIREVEVVDHEKPVIELTGATSQTMCPNQDYQEEGFKAYDDYEGDLTDKVEIIKTEVSYKYKVQDSSGNVVVVEREIIKKDADSPTIRLSSGETVYVRKGSTYRELGYTATDKCDGDLTDKVVVSGNVDTNTLGTYELVYKVQDSSGNENKVVRKVVVNEVKTSESVGKPGVIYLTFDDGPTSNGSTQKILDVLKEEGVKATFFVIGTGNDALIKREFDEGHTIALHSYTHKYDEIYVSVDAYFKDLTKLQNKVKNITGTTSTIIRFPGGSNNTVSNQYNKGIMSILKDEVENRGFIYFDWNVDASDAWQCARSNVKDKKTCVYNNVTKNLSKKRSNIVLMHDIKSYTADAIKDIIKYGKENGYVFEAITTSTKPVQFN